MALLIYILVLLGQMCQHARGLLVGTSKTCWHKYVLSMSCKQAYYVTAHGLGIGLLKAWMKALSWAASGPGICCTHCTVGDVQPSLVNDSMVYVGQLSREMGSANGANIDRLHGVCNPF